MRVTSLTFITHKANPKSPKNDARQQTQHNGLYGRAHAAEGGQDRTGGHAHRESCVPSATALGGIVPASNMQSNGRLLRASAAMLSERLAVADKQRCAARTSAQGPPPPSGVARPLLRLLCRPARPVIVHLGGCLSPHCKTSWPARLQRPPPSLDLTNAPPRVRTHTAQASSSLNAPMACHARLHPSQRAQPRPGRRRARQQQPPAYPQPWHACERRRCRATAVRLTPHRLSSPMQRPGPGPSCACGEWYPRC